MKKLTKNGNVYLALEMVFSVKFRTEKWGMFVNLHDKDRANAEQQIEMIMEVVSLTKKNLHIKRSKLS